MKKLITIMAVVMMSFAVTAFADDDFAVLGGTDTGTMIYEASLNNMPIGHEEQFKAEKPLADVGVELYNSFLADQIDFSGARGVAAGGRGAVDETTLIWDKVVAPADSME